MPNVTTPAPILLTGFDLVGGDPINPSGLLAGRRAASAVS